jgi:FkbM family methyltransferase
MANDRINVQFTTFFKWLLFMNLLTGLWMFISISSRVKVVRVKINDLNVPTLLFSPTQARKRSNLSDQLSRSRPTLPFSPTQARKRLNLSDQLSRSRLLTGVPLWALDRSYVGGETKPLFGTSVVTSDIEKASKSQSSEESYLWEHFFFQRTGGTFLEMGALDGIFLSNTLALENLLGWRGVLIEASPANYGKLQQQRKTQIVINAAVCDEVRTVHYMESGDTAVRGIVEFMAPSFVSQWHTSYRPEQIDQFPSIPCVPLDLLLGLYGFRHINFFSLDVEGAELQVLRALDFSAISFDVLVVEADEHNKTKNIAVVDLLDRAGYKFHEHFLRNDWFVRRGFEPHGVGHVQQPSPEPTTATSTTPEPTTTISTTLEPAGVNHIHNSSFQHRCEAKLRQEGLWRDWVFAQPTSQPPLIWLDKTPYCYKQINGKCILHFEWDWIFSFTLRWVPGVDPSQVIADGEFRTLSEGGIYVYEQGTHDTTAGSISLLAKALCVCEAGATLIHIDDESGLETPAYSEWPLIIRNYFNKAVLDNPKWGKKVVIVPLGHASTFWANPPDRLPGFQERTNSWAFYGDPHKSTRNSMQSAMNTVPGGFSYYTSGGFATAEMIPPYTVRETLARSIFCPCPTGWTNPDSFRFSEALEAGCFPIVDAGNFQKGYFTEYFEQYDAGSSAMEYIMQVPNQAAWADVPLRIEKAMMNMTALQTQQAAMVVWWNQFKEKLSRHVADRIMQLKPNCE